MQDHTKLLVWQRARSLTVSVGEVAKAFTPTLAPGLRAQLMRSTMSISACIVEGAGRFSRADFARFVSMAASSASETEHHLNVACDLGLIEPSSAARLTDRVIEVRKMLFGLHRALLSADDDTRPPKTDPDSDLPN
jgi:four helix bundle protein